VELALLPMVEVLDDAEGGAELVQEGTETKVPCEAVNGGHTTPYGSFALMVSA